MLKELDMLRALLIAAVALAPHGTSHLLRDASRRHRSAHLTAAALVAFALVLDIGYLSLAWLLFSLLSLLQFVRGALARPLPIHIVQAVPFVFGLVGAIWLFAGANDLGLLGYAPSFSFYAALHSTVLGWLMLGCLATMATQLEQVRLFVSFAVFLCLCSFFAIAIGIDQAPKLKPFGVLGISLTVLASQVVLLYACRKSRWALCFAAASLLGFLYTIGLAWQHEIGSAEGAVQGVRSMVSLHGLINGLVVAPAMLLAVHLRFARER